MLRIRTEQLNALSQARYEDFEERAIRHLQEFFPDKVNDVPAEQLRIFLRACVERAGAFGLKSEQAVMCFAHLPLLLGEDFESQPRWAFVPFVLRQEEYPPNDRVKLAMLLAYGLKAKGF